MSDRGAVKQDGLAVRNRTRRGLGNRSTVQDPQLDGSHPVVERQVEHVLATAGGDARDQLHRIGRRLGRKPARQPTPTTCAVTDIQIDTADTGCRHVRQRQARSTQGPAGVNRGRRRDKPNTHPRRILAQRPNRLPYQRLGRRRQPIKKRLRLLESSTLDIQRANVCPADFLSQHRIRKQQENRDGGKNTKEVWHAKSRKGGTGRCHA